jgi:hypothetical protein
MLSKEAIFSHLRFGSSVESTDRHPLSKEMAQSLREQFSNLSASELSQFSCEQHRSSQRGARSDILVYNAAGVLRYEGRKFPSTDGIAFWRHSAS